MYGVWCAFLRWYCIGYNTQVEAHKTHVFSQPEPNFSLGRGLAVGRGERVSSFQLVCSSLCQ